MASMACAVLSSVCLVGLVLVLGLLTDLLYTSGNLEIPAHDASNQWLRDQVGGPDQFTPGFPVQIYRARGLLGLVWRARDSWYGGLLSNAYLRFPALRDNYACLVLILLFGLSLALIRAACWYGQSRWNAALATDVATKVRRAIHRQAYRLGTTEIAGIGLTPAAHMFVQEVDALRDGVLAWLDASVREPVKLVLLLGLALLVRWELAMLYLVLVALGTILAVRLTTRAHQRGLEVTRGAAEGLSLLQESLYLIRLARSYLMESYEQNRFEDNLTRFETAEMRRLRSSAAVWPTIEFTVLACIALFVGLAGYNLLSGELSAGGSSVLYASLLSLYTPVRTALRQLRTLRAGTAAAAGIYAFLDQPPRLGQIAGASFLPPMSRELRFEDIQLDDSNGEALLGGVNLVIPVRSRSALMGMDERAKRALVYLLPRFLDPTAGQVRIDGQDVRLVTLESLRAQIALVLNERLVFNDTVAGNIGCGDTSYGLPHIVEAAKIAHAHHFIHRLPNGYDTPIGELGEPLSIGQQFRIALARAILRDPAIVVIEEPTAGLDEDTKAMIDDTMTRFCPGRTVIFLPRRLSTIRSCDTIVLLHNGKIESMGNHRELTLSNELYRHLQYTQFNVFATS
jgi:ABC-type multidrug transport system fused ATPase/permease subunit